MNDFDRILRLPPSDPNDEPWPDEPEDQASPASSPPPGEPHLVPIQPQPSPTPRHPADAITGDSLRREYAAAMKLHKPDPDIPSAYPPEPPARSAVVDSNPGNQTTKRSRGGQPGNLNALKHGLYIDGRSVRNTTPVERAQLFDINDIIENCKDYMRYTYEHGIRLNDMLEINETMRSLSLAAIGLTRLINTHAEYIATPYSSDFQVKKRSTIIDLVEHYKKKLAPFMDLSDVITDPNAEK